MRLPHFRVSNKTPTEHFHWFSLSLLTQWSVNERIVFVQLAVEVVGDHITPIFTKIVYVTQSWSYVFEGNIFFSSFFIKNISKMYKTKCLTNLRLFPSLLLKNLRLRKKPSIFYFKVYQSNFMLREKTSRMSLIWLGFYRCFNLDAVSI